MNLLPATDAQQHATKEQSFIYPVTPRPLHTAIGARGSRSRSCLGADVQGRRCVSAQTPGGVRRLSYVRAAPSSLNGVLWLNAVPSGLMPRFAVAERRAPELSHTVRCSLTLAILAPEKIFRSPLRPVVDTQKRTIATCLTALRDVTRAYRLPSHRCLQHGLPSTPRRWLRSSKRKAHAKRARQA